MAGKGDMLGRVIDESIKLGIQDRVAFTGFLQGDDIAKAYSMAKLYVMPSISEPFGLTPLESIKHGTPVLISKQSGVSEVLEHSLKVDFWDINQMANKIVSVLRYKELETTLVEESFNEVLNMSWDSSAKKCINIYQRLLS
jgi:glycosyltransferase involved in cell wall biosynthesis